MALAHCMRPSCRRLSPASATGGLQQLLQSYWPAQWGHVLTQLVSSQSPPPMPQQHPRCSARRSAVYAVSTDTAPSAQVGETYSLRVAKEDIQPGKGKLRLDAYLATRLAEGNTASRAKVQTSIKAGLVTVNGRKCDKPSQALAKGDQVVCTLLPGPSLEAMPEAIPLDVAYEDEHLMVINKPAGMPAHISPGHHSGTLVNALLAHCGLPGVRIDPTYPSNLPVNASAAAAASHAPDGYQPALSLEALQRDSLGWVAGSDEDSDEEDASSDDSDVQSSSTDSRGDQSRHAGGKQAQVQSQQQAVTARAGGTPGVLRPGIVHRLDMGTSGLLVVAKREAAQRALSAQFKARTVDRTYLSLTVGCPSPDSGRVMTNIDRDPGDRKRMTALPYGGTKGRTAVSNYQVLERFGDGAAALVQWKLETGRTHQIRVHARHLGHALLSDVTYGGGASSAATAMSRGKGKLVASIRATLEQLNRPALHARSLGFTHPATGQRLSFQCDMPPDMQAVLAFLRQLPSAE